MSDITKSIDVNAAVSDVYNTWTQFESYPRFMSGVDEIVQIDETHLHWKTSIAGHQEEFDALITEQVPDQRVAWESQGGAEHSGVVTFQSLGDSSTKVTLQMIAVPESTIEKVGDKLGILDRQLQGDLEKFREMIEKSGPAADGWRGEVHDGVATTVTATDVVEPSLSTTGLDDVGSRDTI